VSEGIREIFFYATGVCGCESEQERAAEKFFSPLPVRERERERGGGGGGGSTGEVWVGLYRLLRQNLGCAPTSSTASSRLGCTALLERERERERERRKMRVLWMVGDDVLIGCFSPHLIWCDNPSCPIRRKRAGFPYRSYPFS
jgi:hypothetical protein